MSNKIKIYLIYADDCKDCKNLKLLIERAIRDCGKDVILEEVNFPKQFHVILLKFIS